MKRAIWARGAGVLAVIGLAWALAACMLVPGKFDAALDIRRDGGFTWHYTGEIIMPGLTEMTRQMEQAKAPHSFVARPCRAPGDAPGGHPCSTDEVAAQQRTFDMSEKTRIASSQRESAQLKALLGGIDPADPNAAADFAARLRKQEGWRRVEVKGAGVFDVDFTVTGRLDRDFSFPVVERLPLVTSFVALSRRKDGTVRIETPGLAQAGLGQIMALMGQGALGQNPLGQSAVGQNASGPTGLPEPRVVDGHFSLTTDAPILANNTDDGPKPDPRGQRLEWTVNARQTAAPTALLQLSR